MDTGRLLKIVQDVQADEQKFGLQTKFQNILNYYNEQPPNAEALNNEKSNLKTEIPQTKAGGYVASDHQVLETIGIADYFGLGSLARLESILDGQSHEIGLRLNEFVQARQAAITKLEAARSSLDAFGMKSQILEGDNYEIGFSFPDSYKDLGELNKVLKELQQFLESLSDATGHKESIAITSVENGSILIFIHAGIELAQHFDAFLTHIAGIYGHIELYRRAFKIIAKYTPQNKRAAEKIAKDQKKHDIEAIVEKIVEEINPKNKTQTSDIRGRFMRLVKHLENGVRPELRAPDIEEPQKPSTGATAEEQDQFAEKKKIYEVKKQIDVTNQKIYLLQQSNFLADTSKLLSEALPDDDDNVSEKNIPPNP